MLALRITPPLKEISKTEHYNYSQAMVITYRSIKNSEERIGSSSLFFIVVNIPEIFGLLEAANPHYAPGAPAPTTFSPIQFNGLQLHFQKPDGVENAEERHAGIGEDRNPHVGIAQKAHDHDRDFDEEGEAHILPGRGNDFS
jgi:hypothetical protein